MAPDAREVKPARPASRRAGKNQIKKEERTVGPFLDGSAPTRLPGARLTSLRAQSPSGGLTSPAAHAWGQHFRDRGWFPALFNPPMQRAIPG